MKTTALFSSVLLAAAISGAPARAQDGTPVPDPSANMAEPAVINHVVYLARLPAPAELIKSAESRATPITRMDQTTDRIVVTYQYAGNRPVTFAYILLSSAASAPAPLATDTNSGSASQPVVVQSSAPRTTVVYTEPDRVYYSPSYVRYYDPVWDFWAPLTVGVGLGWIGGHSHGGWHGSGGWHSHGGWHR